MTTDTDSNNHGSHTYPDGEEPTVPPTERESFEPSTEWVNYWDMHPVDHGGTFVRWDGDRGRWEVIEVTPPSAHPVGENTYLVTEHSFTPYDVWENPSDPLTRWSDGMASEVSALHNSPDHPNVKPFVSEVDHYVAGLTHRLRPSRTDSFKAETVAEYWDAVRRFGVDPSEVHSVSDDSLPDDVTDDD
jgi:hypothetical protein